MSYTLQDFCADMHAILVKENNPAGRDKVREKMAELLKNDEFIKQFCGPDKKNGVYTLNEDPETGAVVLSHCMDKAHMSPPHDHGTSWAIYGQAAEHTVMREYERVDDGSDPDKAELKVTKEYKLNKGDVGVFNPGKIHSIDYPDNARFVRVTGVDLDRIDRTAFNTESGTAQVIRSQGVAVD